MTNKEFILEAKGRIFSDEELIELLYNINPKSMKQAKIINGTLQKLLKDEPVSSVDEYLNNFTAADFTDKEVRGMFSQYCQWCSLNNMEIQSNKAFTQAVEVRFNLKSTVVKVDGKSVRVYKEL